MSKILSIFLLLLFSLFVFKIKNSLQIFVNNPTIFNKSRLLFKFNNFSNFEEFSHREIPNIENSSYQYSKYYIDSLNYLLCYSTQKLKFAIELKNTDTFNNTINESIRFKELAMGLNQLDSKERIKMNVYQIFRNVLNQNMILDLASNSVNLNNFDKEKLAVLFNSYNLNRVNEILKNQGYMFFDSATKNIYILGFNRKDKLNVFYFRHTPPLAPTSSRGAKHKTKTWQQRKRNMK